MSEWYAQVPIFAGMSNEALALLAGSADRQLHAPESVVFRQGDEGHHFYLIESGAVRVEIGEGTASPSVLAILGPGEFFGEMAILECVRRSATVVCEAPTLLHRLSNADLHRLFKSHPDQYAILILNIARDLARRLHGMDDRFVHRCADKISAAP